MPKDFFHTKSTLRSHKCKYKQGALNLSSNVKQKHKVSPRSNSASWQYEERWPVSVSCRKIQLSRCSKRNDHRAQAFDKSYSRMFVTYGNVWNLSKLLRRGIRETTSGFRPLVCVGEQNELPRLWAAVVGQICCKEIKTTASDSSGVTRVRKVQTPLPDMKPTLRVNTTCV